uniref:Uncharacterized protein n=1 Tax=Ditylum brightwellii TaxID=49249 RepID=A0A7S4RV97_9STRA
MRKGGQLYSKLCVATEGGDCTYPSVVTLNESLTCDVNVDPECSVEMLRVVQVTSGVFYEYQRPPCVQLSFYSNPKQVNARAAHDTMCANPALPVATRKCCNVPIEDGQVNQYVNFDVDKR